MKKPPASSWLKLLKKVHSDEKGSASLEQLLILGATSLPILIYVLKSGWPRIRGYFTSGLDELETAIKGVNG